jgi:hypothetical protein
MTFLEEVATLLVGVVVIYILYLIWGKPRQPPVAAAAASGHRGKAAPPLIRAGSSSFRTQGVLMLVV